MTEHQHIHPHSQDMLSVEEALERLLGLVHELPTEELPILDAQGLALAQEVRARFDIPELTNSAMDGYAVRAADVTGASVDHPVTLRVVGQVQAGYVPTVPVTERTAIRIMTGAPLPDGADAVVPYELTDEPARIAVGEKLIEIAIRHGAQPSENVRPAGEDVTRGSLVMEQGHVLDPPAIGMLASLGLDRVRVVRRPRVAILATGDEVLVPGSPPETGRLYDINSYSIGALVERCGAIPQLLGIARDNMQSLRGKLQASLDADMLITSAGVSGGAYDMVKEALAEQGSIALWAVRMRPARPLAFGLLNAGDRQVPHLGLPGNPVSALVAMAIFGRPALYKMMGRPAAPLPMVEAVLDEPIHNIDGRRVYARVTLERRDGVLHARLTGAQGSNLLNSMVHAQGLAICAEELKERAAGERVPVQLLDWCDLSSILG